MRKLSLAYLQNKSLEPIKRDCDTRGYELKYSRIKKGDG